MKYLILFSSISSILNSMFVRFTVRPVWVVYPLYELDIFPVIYGKRRENQSINPSHTGSNRSRSTSWVLTINFVKSCRLISNIWWIGWKNTPHLWKVSKCLNFFFQFINLTQQTWILKHKSTKEFLRGSPRLIWYNNVNFFLSPALTLCSIDMWVTFTGAKFGWEVRKYFPWKKRRVVIPNLVF